MVPSQTNKEGWLTMIRRVVPPPISVLTVTRRAANIHRCLSSLTRQNYSGTIEHLVLVDGDIDVFYAWKNASNAISDAVSLITRTAQDHDGPARLAYMRNMAVGLARSEYLVFLDDDNAWDSNHLSALWAALIAGNYYMAHSHRLLFENDGRPYLRPEFPWKREKAERERIYRLHMELGIVTPGTNIIRDYVGMPYSCVDLGEWLLRREFLILNPFVCTYSEKDWWTITVEDAKLSSAIVDSNLPVACSQLPTLHYYLGGYSNNFSDEASIYWRPPVLM